MKYCIYIISLVSVTLLFPKASKGQKEGNVWLFGVGICLDFNSGKAVELSTKTQINTREGCSSICDTSGSLLFYTDGVSVWNRMHNLMLNGYGLRGNTSTTQSALIVQWPDNDSLYYIFTTDCIENNLAQGLNYNVVNLKAEGGYGAVISRNNLLNPSSAEKLTATVHANGKDIWVIAHTADGNVYDAYLITKKGLNTKPVKSSCGLIYSSSKNVDANIGCIAISPDGSKMATAIYGRNRAEVFNFDNSSGKIDYWFTINNLADAYGAGFSSNSNILYITYNLNKGLVRQYNLALNDTLKILDKTYQLKNTGYFGDIQLGPDRKLYCPYVFSDSLLVIDDPNITGINCRAHAFHLKSEAIWGLPNMMQSYFARVAIDYISKCYFDPVTFSFNGTTPDSVFWNFGDKTSSNNTSKLFNPAHQYNAAGLYRITLVSYKKSIIDTNRTMLALFDKPHTIDSNIYLCPSDVAKLDVTGNGYTYQWNDGAISGVHYTSYTSYGDKYWVKVNNGTCVITDTFRVIDLDSLKTFNIKDINVCDKASTVLNVKRPGATYTWQDGSNLPTLSVTKNGLYSVKTIYQCGTDTQAFRVSFMKKIKGPVWKDTFMCGQDTLLLDAYEPYATYTWQDGSKLSHFVVRQNGTYSVKIKTYCDSIIKKIAVIYIGKPLPPYWRDTIICKGQSVFLNAFQHGVSYLWQDGSSKPGYIAKNNGTYSVKIMTHCDTVVSTMQVKLRPKLSHKLWKDTSICEGDSLKLGINDSNAIAYWWLNGYQFPFINVKKAGLYGLYTMNACDTFYRSMKVLTLPGPQDFKLSDSTICRGDIMEYKIHPYGNKFKWQDGSQDSTYPISKEGTYWLTISNQCGIRSDTMHIKAEDCALYLQIPNVFTPNADGLNDFYIAYLNRIPKSYNLSIYNRWGELVYHTDDYTNGWDGTFHNAPAMEGMYKYILNVRGYRHDEIYRSGTVMLIRQ